MRLTQGTFSFPPDPGDERTTPHGRCEPSADTD